jgi:co-chaperonin GroES (HSP10)
MVHRAQPSRSPLAPFAGRAVPRLQVLAVGSDVTMALAKGDMVVYQKYAMAEVELKEGQVLFVAEKSIMGKLE